MNGNQLIEKIERSQMYREAHEGAILINKGQTYIVTDVDFNTHIIDVIKRDVNAHTIALKRTETKIIKKIKKVKIGDFTVHYGELEVEEDYYKYKRMEFSKTIGTYILDLPPLKFKTKGLWFTIPDSVKETLEERFKNDSEVFPGGLHGAEHALIGLFPLHVMCDRFDIGGLSTNYHEDTQEASIFIYDAYEGGIGICEKAIDVFSKLTNSTRNLLKTCECENGCPSCIYSPKCGNDNKPLHKKATEFILDYMWEEMNKLSPEELSALENQDLEDNISYNETYYNQKEKNNMENEEDKETIESEPENKADEDINNINPLDEAYDDALEEFNKGNYSIAKEILTNIIIKEDSADAYYLIGKILYEQDDKLGALSFVKKAISIDPVHEDANEFLLELKH